MTEPEAIAALDRIIAQLQAIRAERWLQQWPSGHPERPNPPLFVTEYLAKKAS